ncbi:hypothetical protein K490DRAFT_55003 [Saccharata proteae CBS 121410]|uniref:Uncharacterized protein n=1 Tax=Saccharata proteae CBS 121410 TaxID=1314787 RepID=A0A6A5YBY7_9PEZI|nr:hypothetical protein K490DRAFT_55003 [Saccharata proteae CBS 121410]
MSLTAPYDNAMRLGQGFNTYTQEIRIEDAVKIGSKRVGPNQVTGAATAVKPQLLPVPKRSAPVVVTPPASPPVTPSKRKGISDTADSKNEGTSRAGTAGTEAISELPGAAALKSRSLPSPAASIMGDDSDVEVFFDLSDAPLKANNQSVTFSTRAIDNVSDIMDALNISTALSIKYGTIHGNGSASFVNENKVLDSQLNYVVSVKVNNDADSDPQDMEFHPIDDLPPEKFTEVYGDAFISGFLEGGEFNAVISIQVNDRSKLRSVKQAVDLQLALGPSPVSVGAKESIDKSHHELLQDTEITISVNWTGGGDIKKPEVPWTLSSVVAIANAFPSMVARHSSKTAAVLTRYTSLRSFQAWRWKRIAQESAFADKFEILNYTPCTLYTADLFDALMTYKKLWKHIGHNRKQTFMVPDPLIHLGFSLDTLNSFTAPIPLDPCALNEARLLCREAMTLITEEAARLVDHPHLAYADFDPLTRRTRMKRPNYAYPEVLAERLPVRLDNDAASATQAIAAASSNGSSVDAAAILTQSFAPAPGALYCHLIGDAPDPDRRYKPFTSLALTEPRRGAGQTDSRAGASTGALSSTSSNSLTRLSIHGYTHHAYQLSSFSSASAHAIGGLGFSTATNTSSDTTSHPDGCAHHYGHEASSPDNWIASNLSTSTTTSSLAAAEVSRVDVYWVPGEGRIAGLVLYDEFAGKVTERLGWRQWVRGGRRGEEPRGLRVLRQEAPRDGERWTFVGVTGEWDESVLGGSVLSRVSGVWRKL